MKFITEYDLRTQFNAQPFTNYQVEEGTRLTPGARQFLSDRGINLFEDGTAMRFGMPAENLEDKKPPGQQPTPVQAAPVQPAVQEQPPVQAAAVPEPEPEPEIQAAAHLPKKPKTEEEDTLAIAKLVNKMEILEAEFLVKTSQLIEHDIDMAQTVSRVARQLGSLRGMIAGETTKLEVPFEPCSGMSAECCCQDLGNCFEISDFYIQLPNGKTLVILNLLRAQMRELRILAAEAFSRPEDEKRLVVTESEINQMINKLSQMICKAAGVKECKRNH